MLYIYNETKTPWRCEKINDNLNKFIVKKKIDEERTKRIEIVTTNDVVTNSGETVIALNKPMKIYDGMTGILFQKKDCAPMITTSTKYGKDIMLFNINLKGSFIKNINTTNVFILTYMVAKSEFSSVISISDTNDIVFDLELHNPKEGTDTIYKLIKTTDGYEVKLETKEATEIIEAPTFKIHKFRPARPTNLIFVNKEDVNTLTSTILENPEKFTIKEFTQDNIAEVIAEAKSEGFRAVTLFHNVDIIQSAIGRHYGLIKKEFQILNILLNTGKVIKR